MNRTKRRARGNPQMRLVIMLAVAGATGSILFAAESPATRAPAAAAAMDETGAMDTGAQVHAQDVQIDATADSEQAVARSDDKTTRSAEPVLGRDEPSVPARAPERSAKPKQDPPSAQSTAPAPGEAQRSAGSPQRFKPSEEVRADFDVSFPIDI